jgi:internalin A
VDVTAIGKLTALTHLDLSHNMIEFISVLYSCKNLSELLISNNKITNIQPLTQCSKLERLDFSHNSVASLPTWNKNALLYAIDGSHNKLTNVKSLSGLTNLCTVTLDYNSSLSDVKPLTKCPNLGVLSVYGTKVRDISAFTALEITVYYDPI